MSGNELVSRLQLKSIKAARVLVLSVLLLSLLSSVF